jgi:hypothetical protein
MLKMSIRSIAARKFLTNYLCRKFSYTLQDGFIIFSVDYNGRQNTKWPINFILL